MSSADVNDYVTRLREFLKWWAEHSKDFAISPEDDTCDPPCIPEGADWDNPDILVAQWIPEVKKLLASDIAAALDELEELRDLVPDRWR